MLDWQVKTTGASRVNERQTIDRGWFYVLEPEDGANAPESKRIRADDGRVLTRRLHGFPGHLEVTGPRDVPRATLLRAAAAVGHSLEALGQPHRQVAIDLQGETPSLSSTPDGRLRLTLPVASVAEAASHHQVDELVRSLLPEDAPAPVNPPAGRLPERPVARALFFESLMNTDMPHNDKEISQGVLHMVTGLREHGTEVVLVNAKMPIVGDDRAVLGLENLSEALEDGPIGLVGITLLEGYWEGVQKLIATLRDLGCRARIAVGGVMPSLAPEHVTAHLPDVQFICRGAGEYFVPRLARILGDTDVDSPLTEAQRHALLQMDGMLVVDPAGPRQRLLASNCARTMTVTDLSRVELDLRYLQPRHIEGGVEISTSRGCIHKCSFCSILGRESYQARSAGSVFSLLDSYQARFEQLYGDRIPHNAYRVHISDDDFACDRQRTIDFFQGLPSTPFRLSSVQVAVGDLCRRENGKLLAEPDHELLDAIRADCFADHGLPIPASDYFEDHKSRTWSSFLQIGVETYSDPEIARLGKGYKRIHIRTIVAELARRALHMDGYFILSNAETSADDLIDVFFEVARLKLRFPQHFHMRFPVVPRLVSYFTAASHRRHVRRGRAHVMKLRGHAAVPGHSEFDYPFVDHDISKDDLVERTVQTDFVTDARMYTGNLDVLTELWTRWRRQLSPGDPERTRMGRLLRRLDDSPRRVVFEMLRQAWLDDHRGWPGTQLDKSDAIAHAERVLGPHDAWIRTSRHAVRTAGSRRLVLAPDISPELAREALGLLRSSDASTLQVHLVQPDAALLAAIGQPDDIRVLVETRDAHSPADPQSVEHQAVLEPGITTLVAAASTVIVRLAPDIDPTEALRAAAASRPQRLVLEPTAQRWTDRDARLLAQRLFALADALRGLPLLRSGVVRSAVEADVAVDREGYIGRSDGLDHTGLLADAYRLGHLDDMGNLDRYHLNLADPTSLRGVTDLASRDTLRQPVDAVLKSFEVWLKPEQASGRSGRVRP